MARIQGQSGSIHFSGKAGSGKLDCQNMPQSTPSEWLKIYTDWVKIGGALVVFIIGLWQYTRAQKWKRREFIAAQIKDFEADKDIQLVMIILDWTDRKLYFPSVSGGNSIEVRVDDQLLCSALLPHEAASRYSADEVMIRDRIDRFLEMLVRLDNFVEARLINVAELRPYVGYWIRLISGNMPGWHTPEVFVLLLNYIQRYGFDGAQRLITRFGYDAVPSAEAVRTAIAKTVKRRKKAEFQVNPDYATDPPMP